jgi:hypothetical protein
MHWFCSASISDAAFALLRFGLDGCSDDLCIVVERVARIQIPPSPSSAMKQHCFLRHRASSAIGSAATTPPPPVLLAPLSELGLPHVQIEVIIESHNFGSQTFAIKDLLSLRICTERSYCPELREYLSG